MILKNRKAFTLLELIIVVTIISILTLVMFVPYNFYSNIWKVRISWEIIDQAKNEAILNSNSVIDKTTKKNLNVWIRIKKDSNILEELSYPYDFTWSVYDTGTVLKQIKLEDWVNVNQISLSWTVTNNDVLIYFKAPNWEMTIYKDIYGTWSNVDITIWYKTAVTWVLSKVIKINQ